MAVFMIWYRTAAGKLTTVKIQAATKAKAVKQFKRKVRDTPPFRVLKLKVKPAPARSKKRKRVKGKKRKSARMGKCGKAKADIVPFGEEKHTDIFVHGKKKKRRKAKKSGKRKAKRGKRLSGRNLTLIPKGDKAKAEAQKDKLKNNIIIYGSKRKGGSKMPKMKLDIVETLVNGLTGAAGGAIGGAAVTFIPVPEKMKPFIPLLLGLAIPMIPAGKKELKQAASIGLITVGTLAILKQFMPTLPIYLQGQDENAALTEADLQTMGLIEEQAEDVEALGENIRIDGEVVSMGENDFITSADN